MGTISYTISDAGMKEKLAKSETQIKEKAVVGLNKLGVLTQSKLREKAPRDTSNMVNQIHVVQATTETLTAKIVGGAIYTSYVDQGTSAHFPPVSALIGWSRRHKWAGVVDTKASRKAFAEKQAKYKRSIHSTHKGKHTKSEEKHTTAYPKGSAEHAPKKNSAFRNAEQGLTVEGQAFLIARAISKRGGKAQNFVEPVITEMREQAKSIMLEAIKGAVT